MGLGTATPVVVTAPTGKTLGLTVRKIGTDGTLGDYWHTTTGWQAADPAWADKDIALTEGSDEDIGSYSGVIPDLDYTGRIAARVHDEGNSYLVLSQEVYRLTDGTPADEAPDLSSESTISPVTISPTRTFYMHDSIDGTEAPNIIEIPTGSATTLAFDFSRVLNPGQGVSSGAVTVAAGSAVTFASQAADGAAMQLHSTLTPTGVGDRTLTCTITTTDSQSLVGTAYLQVS